MCGLSNTAKTTSAIVERERIETGRNLRMKIIKMLIEYEVHNKAL
jgi:hypothetical protein